jgi:ribosomal protein S20
MGKSEKLLFPLCRTCANNKIQKCNHSDSERAIIGTWTTDEVNKAIDKGYRIEKIYEVWHFKEKSNELFRGYVKDFMKIKLETSSWKNDFNTIEEYINTVKEKLDITLDKNNIQENPGKRAVAKICLNSLWGKFGQRQNMSKTEYVTDIKRFYEIMLDDRLDNINLTFLKETMVQMSYSLKDVFVENDHNTNVFIAAFTTSNARLRLYEMLDYLGERVIYYDTDSIVYIDDGTKPIKTGCMLGEWTDELGGDYITNWVSTGPKSYDYVTNSQKEMCKIKGFFLNYENSQFLNFKTMSKMVKKDCKGVTIVEENKITRDPKTKNIVNKYQEKFFSFDYDKRVINKINDEIIDTLPYGY